MSRVEKMQGMLAVGAISTKQGKQFMFSAKKGLKQEVALLTMSAAPLSQVSGEEDHHEAGDVNENEEEYEVDRSPGVEAQAQAKAPAIPASFRRHR